MSILLINKMSTLIKDYMKMGLSLVNQTNIENYRNKYVIVHGKVQSIKNNTLNLLIDPVNNYVLLVNGFREKKSMPEDFVAIIGRVASDKSLDFVDMFQLDKDFDLDFANEIVAISTHPNTKQFFERN